MKDRLYKHLAQIVRKRDPYLASEGHFFVQQYIREQLSQWGEVTTHEFEVRGQKYQNLILNLPAATPQQLPPILIGAHYDAVPGTPGADDNGTGVAVLLELAAAFAEKPLKYPIRIVAFDMEEYGLLGSKAYAAYLKQNKQALRLMLSLEMLGYRSTQDNSQQYPADIIKYFYPSKGDFIALVSNLITIPDTIRLHKSLRQHNLDCQWLPVPNNGKWISGTGFSDHSPFWEQGYRAMMVTDTAFLRNPHYHKSSDTIETLDGEFLTDVCRGLIKGIYDLAN
ncbi:putative aminopeptidase [Xenococcus sp. PCC 7305]|uniref:M20/M25/M40 family metallo-hydrolase n=1 Tax=Xenococcus sp. PCC 7305 TaxID=102125 RepID=UPI0002ABEF37|nr:M20/M25/M40 family metallo-hydrolase [Xenococcus sp. PCC 7305]ELS01461.1 putative aminopeptidase [Xenococcus sp. PCC 7305]